MPDFSGFEGLRAGLHFDDMAQNMFLGLFPWVVLGLLILACGIACGLYLCKRRQGKRPPSCSGEACE